MRDYIWHTSFVWFREAQSITLHENSKIVASYIQLQADGPITAAAGSNITSLIQNQCNMELKNSHLFSCVPKHSLEEQVTKESFIAAFNQRYKSDITHVAQALGHISQNYTIYIMSFDKIRLDEATVSAPRIGMCSHDIYSFETEISAAQKGCSAPDGHGIGGHSSVCPGAGGSHGGHGGYGSTGSEDECLKFVKPPFWNENSAMYEGSPGGRGNSTKGGNGGGIVWLSATGTIDLTNSKVNVSGGDGHNG